MFGDEAVPVPVTMPTPVPIRSYSRPWYADIAGTALYVAVVGVFIAAPAYYGFKRGHKKK